MPRKTSITAACLAILIFSLGGCQPALAPDSDPAETSLNGARLVTPAQQPFRFLVVGHLYGSTEGEDIQPGSNLLAKVPELNALNLSLLVSLGDMVKHSRAEDFDALDAQLLQTLPFPVYNVPGNHDVGDRALYEARYGKTYSTFRYGTARLIFLDTEIKPCQINTAQQEMLSQALNAALREDSTQIIFVFMHKTLFFDNAYLYAQQKHTAMPNVWECYGKTNFDRVLKERILPVVAKKPVILFAGDVGAWGNLSPYYEEREGGRLKLVMTGLGDTPADSGILVSVDGEKVSMEPYSLTGETLPALESFSPNFWNQRADEEE